MKPIASALSLGLMIILSGCGSSSDSASSSSTPTTPTASITIADTFTAVLDVDKEDVVSDWNSSTIVTGSSASLVTDGLYGNCVINGTSVTYTKTTETNATDSCVLSIDNSQYIKVTVDALFWKQISAHRGHTAAIKSDGTLWSWGRGSSGQLGIDSVLDQTVPTQEDSNKTWQSVSTGADFTVAIASDGTLWAWGANNYGQLGNGSTQYKYVPTQEDSNGTSWKSVSASYYHTMAIKEDGTLWTWGRNYYGQLGDNTNNDRYTPTQENSHGTTWKSLSAGTSHSAAIKEDGTLWTWGYNDYGQLGDNTQIDRNIPTQEDSNGTWNSVSAGDYHTAAIRSDGTLWSMGYGYYGQIGDNSTTNKMVPTQENTNSTSWSSVSAGGYFTRAIKSDGTLWAWGRNDNGRLGDGTTVDKLIPTQESTAQSWKSVSGYVHGAAIKNDGTFWAWGTNTYGQFGNGNTVDNQSPTKSITRN